MIFSIIFDTWFARTGLNLENKELTLAKERYNRLGDEVWKLMVQDEHPTNCSCAICVGLRLEDDR